MLNGTVEPLLTMTSSPNRLMSIAKTNGDSNSTNNDTSSKRSTMKASSLGTVSSMNSNNDNRIKFIDMLICGSCQQDFQLSDILKFIEHKAICGNKENKRKIPYFLSQRRRRREGDDEDYDEEEEDDDEEEEEEEDKSQQDGNSSGNENERNMHQSHRQQSSQKQLQSPKALAHTSGNTLRNSGKS
jgi:hypothetical protein